MKARQWPEEDRKGRGVGGIQKWRGSNKHLYNINYFIFTKAIGGEGEFEDRSGMTRFVILI